MVDFKRTSGEGTKGIFYSFPLWSDLHNKYYVEVRKNGELLNVRFFESINDALSWRAEELRGVTP